MTWARLEQTPASPRGALNQRVSWGARGLTAALCLACLLPALWAGCNWLTGPSSRPQPKQGMILEVDRHKAALYINDMAVTLLDSAKPNVIGLDPGTYRVEIRKAGYFSRYYNVTVTAKAFERIRVRMPPELD